VAVRPGAKILLMHRHDLRAHLYRFSQEDDLGQLASSQATRPPLGEHPSEDVYHAQIVIKEIGPVTQGIFENTVVMVHVSPRCLFNCYPAVGISREEFGIIPAMTCTRRA